MTVLDIRQRDENTWYYVLDKKGNEGQLHGSKLYDWSQVSEILGRVPSYDEWKASYNCMLENEVLRLKNAQLKEELESALCEIRGCNYELSKANKQLNVDIAKTYKEKEKLEELLKDLMSESNDALQVIQNDCESEDFSIFNYPEVQTFYTLSEKIDEELKR